MSLDTGRERILHVNKNIPSVDSFYKYAYQLKREGVTPDYVRYLLINRLEIMIPERVNFHWFHYNMMLLEHLLVYNDFGIDREKLKEVIQAWKYATIRYIAKYKDYKLSKEIYSNRRKYQLLDDGAFFEEIVSSI